MRQFCVAGSRIGAVDRLFAVPPKAAVSAVQQLPARGVALLVLMLVLLVAPHLKAQTSVTYPLGPVPTPCYLCVYTPQMAFDGTNIWITHSRGVEKVMASSGAVVGSYACNCGAEGLGGSVGMAFDGNNIWASYGDTVTKLLASTGAVLGTYPTGYTSMGVAFDGTNIWVTNYGGNTVTKLLASTGATVGTYPAGLSPAGIVFDGNNIWVASYGHNTVTKLLASTGAVVGTYLVGTNLIFGIAFDGTNIWVASNLPPSNDNFGGAVTKLLASTGAIVGTDPTVFPPTGITFDGKKIWVDT